MSELQGALVVLGVVAIGAVFLFNKWQERQLRRRGEATLPPRPPSGSVDPVPLSGADDGSESLPDDRREPVLGGEDASSLDPAVFDETARTPGPDGAVRPATVRPRAAQDDGPAGLWFPVRFTFTGAVDESAVSILRERAGRGARAVEWSTVPAVVVDGETPSRVGAALMRVQMVDARGAAGVAELRRLLIQAQQAGEALAAAVAAPEPSTAAGSAAALYEFCQSVDVALGLNVVSSGGGFAGTKLRGLIEASGFRSAPDHTWLLADDEGRVLCTLTDAEGRGLDPQVMRAGGIRAVSLQVDLPRTPGPIAQFERAVSIARQFSQGLSGRLVDDAGRALDDAALDRIRAQLGAMVQSMRQQGFEPGDALARRLFG
ncbi:MAG: cell division protein ZipA C-terminal FtsZ-binding domain-containing protein [Pseudomonadota bacterium]